MAEAISGNSRYVHPEILPVCSDESRKVMNGSFMRDIDYKYRHGLMSDGELAKFDEICRIFYGRGGDSYTVVYGHLKKPDLGFGVKFIRAFFGLPEKS